MKSQQAKRASSGHSKKQTSFPLLLFGSFLALGACFAPKFIPLDGAVTDLKPSAFAVWCITRTILDIIYSLGYEERLQTAPTPLKILARYLLCEFPPLVATFIFATTTGSITTTTMVLFTIGTFGCFLGIVA